MNLPGLTEKPVPVSIVPLWNWNMACWHTLRRRSSVSIVPLWNWNQSTWLPCSRCSSTVSIVPLWNWNRGGCLQRTSRRSRSQSYLYGIEIRWRRMLLVRARVSIVPLWNWNVRNLNSCCRCSGLNRTFMELKSATIKRPRLVGHSSQSYLYGIEMEKRATKTDCSCSLNRTFMELK